MLSLSFNNRVPNSSVAVDARGLLALAG